MVAAMLLGICWSTPQAAPTGTFVPDSLEPRPCASSPGQGPELILIESGQFIMGSGAGDTDAFPDESPQHRVAVVAPFALARCETTVGEFRRFVTETLYRTEAERGGGCYAFKATGDAFERRPEANWRNPGVPQTDAHPVVCVSFNDAQVYARWLSLRTGAQYRLPTEAQWEYAARAGTTGRYYWGDAADQGCAYANGADRTAKQRFASWTIMDCDDGALFTAPAGGYRRNAFGLSDMLGNVWEWTADCSQENYQGAPTDGSAWLEANGGTCARRVLRGGSWSRYPRNLRAAYRTWFTADYGSVFVGFRLARTL